MKAVKPVSTKFIQRLVAAADEAGQTLAGENDVAVWAWLEYARGNLVAKLTGEFGAKVAAEIADSFVKAAAGRKAEIEAAKRHCHAASRRSAGAGGGMTTQPCRTSWCGTGKDPPLEKAKSRRRHFAFSA